MTRANAAFWTVLMFLQMSFGVVLLIRGEWLALLSVIIGVLGFIACGMAITDEETTSG